MIIFIILVIIFYFVRPSATEEEQNNGETDYQFFGRLATILDGLSILIGLMAFVFAFLLLKKGEGIAKRAFVYFLASTFFIALLRQFYFAQGLGMTNVSENVLMVWWHILFYTGIALLIYAITQLKSNVKQQTKLNAADKTILSLAGLIFIAVTISFFTLNDFFTPLLEGTILDHSTGFVHFVAFLMGVYATLAMIKFKSYIQETAKINFNLLFFGVFLLYIIPLWELLTEGWNILNFPGAIVESVEGILSISAITLFLIVYWLANKRLGNEKQDLGESQSGT